MLARLRQRQARQCTHLQLKLRHITRIQCVVTTVVRAWRHLVHYQATKGHRLRRALCKDKKLDAQDAHVVQIFRYFFRSYYRLF